jgi:hypothetical protein
MKTPIAVEKILGYTTFTSRISQKEHGMLIKCSNRQQRKFPQFRSCVFFACRKYVFNGIKVHD